MQKIKKILRAVFEKNCTLTITGVILWDLATVSQVQKSKIKSPNRARPISVIQSICPKYNINRLDRVYFIEILLYYHFWD